MIPAFLKFFRDYPPGVVHSVTQPPKSTRRGDKPHPMDYVCQAVSDGLRVPYVELFEPWDKRKRGRHAEHPEICVKPAARDHVGGVVFILDDVSTTNRTLQAAVSALQAIGMHPHGLAFVLYA